MEKIKLIADKLFYDAVSKRLMPQGVMFYTDKERAVKLVSGGFASIVEREHTTQANEAVEKPKPIEQKPKQPVAKKTKRVAKRKPVK